MPLRFDAAIVGAGAAGLFCAGVAAQRGLRVALIDHAPRLAEKIRISGGGRCNFTNLDADRPERFLSADPSFARHALQAYRPRRFVQLLESHRVGWHEKHRGQLFCDQSSEQVIALLKAECERGGVQWLRPCAVHEVAALDAAAPVAGGPRPRFVLRTDAGEIECASLVVATGGLSIPQIGASDWGYRIARQFGLAVIEPRPALVPLTFAAQGWSPFAELSGLALEVDLSLPGSPDAPRFREDLLFTHRGLSGPAVLQVSSYWRPGEALSVDLAPGSKVAEALLAARGGTRQQVGTALAEIVPRRLAQAWLSDAVVAASAQGGSRGTRDVAPAVGPRSRTAGGPGAPQGAAPVTPSGPPARPLAERRLAELGNRAVRALGERFHDWRVTPAATEGWRKAEVTAGGVSTAELDPSRLAARRVPGLHFIGEVVDVTGWLGGYNFQWAWASGWCAAQALDAG